MSASENPLLQSLLALSWRGKLLVFASLVVTIELLFRYLAPRSAAYKRWTHFFEAIGAVWTVVLLAVVYFVSVAPIGIGARLAGKDLLDRSLRPEPSFWRRYAANPLGPKAAARHQF